MWKTRCRHTIIGGGIVGLSVAYNLLVLGEEKVCLIEKKFLGSGGTTRNAGRFRVHFGNPLNLKFAIESAEYLRRLSSSLGYNPLLSPTGYLWLIYAENTYRRFIDKNRMFSSYGVALEEITPDALYKRFPYLREDGDLIAGFYSSKNGSFHPDIYTFALSDKIARMGGLLMEGLKGRLTTSEGKGDILVKVEGGGEILSDNVIVTAGAWSGELLEQIGISLPLVPVRKEIGVSEPYSYIVEPFIIDEKNRLYFSQTLKGEIIFSCKPREERKGLAPLTNTISWISCMSAGLRKVLKGAGGIRLMRTWSGYYYMSPDKSHLMGRCPEWPEGLYVATGFSGHGFMLGPYTGKILAEHIVYGKDNVYIRSYNPCRLTKGRMVEEDFVVG